MTLFYVFTATVGGGGKVANGFTTLGKVFFDVKFFLEVVSPISKKIFICKNMMTIINRKMDFLDEKLHFSFQKVKSTLQVVNTYAFHPLFSVFFMKIRFLKHWENAAKNVDFLMILNFLHMVTLTSISTKKMKIWNFSIKFKFLHMVILKFFQQFFCFFMHLDFINMVFLTSISTKNMKIWNYYIQF